MQYILLKHRLAYSNARGVSGQLSAAKFLVLSNLKCLQPSKHALLSGIRPDGSNVVCRCRRTHAQQGASHGLKRPGRKTSVKPSLYPCVLLPASALQRAVPQPAMHSEAKPYHKLLSLRKSVH